MRRMLQILFGFTSILFVASASAATFYVAPNGNDASPGTQQQPWKTITKANSTLQAGDTVYLRGGNYDGQTISPTRSGTSDSKRITYSAYAGERPVIRRVKIGVSLSGTQFVTIDGIDMDGEIYRGKTASGWPGVGGGSSNIGNFAELSNASYNVIQNVNWKYAHGWSGIRLSGGSHHNKILNSTFDFVGTYDNGLGDDKGDTLQISNGDNNLIEGCTFRHGGHTSFVIDQGRYNVIRNNYFDGDFSDVEGAGKGQRSVSLKGEGPATRTAGFNLFERNVLVNTKTPSDASDAPALKVIGVGQIVRRNILFNNDAIAAVTSNGSGASNGYVSNNHIYHNVFYNNGETAWSLYFHSTNGITNDNNVYMNNIAFSNRTSSDSARTDVEVAYRDPGLLGRGNLIANNIMLKQTTGDARIFTAEGKDASLSWYENNYPDEFVDNFQIDPKFVASSPITKIDFQLAPTSPAVDAGSHLTVTAAGGSGQSIRVKDAHFFSNGFGVVQGDLIRVGSGLTPVSVLGVDYENHVITIDRTISWANGDPVSLHYAGTAPDVGAFEFGLVDDDSVPRPSPPQNLQATAE